MAHLRVILTIFVSAKNRMLFALKCTHIFGNFAFLPYTSHYIQRGYKNQAMDSS